MFEHLPVLIPCLLALTCLVLAVRGDSRPKRLLALSVSGEVIPGTRIVQAKAWLNVRAGLLNHAGLADGTGLWLKGSRTVHTRGMLFPLDLVFLDGGGRVLAVKADAKPGLKSFKGPAGTAHVLEVGAGTASSRFHIEKGALVHLIPLEEA